MVWTHDEKEFVKRVIEGRIERVGVKVSECWNERVDINRFLQMFSWKRLFSSCLWLCPISVITNLTVDVVNTCGG